MTAPEKTPLPRPLVIPVASGRAIALHRRGAVVTGLLVLAALICASVAMLLGNYQLSAAEVLDALQGQGDPTAQFLVVQQRLPRALAALAVGACLGLSGAIFQSLSRNPLGSPDIVGFTTGATTGGLVILLLTAAPTMASVASGTIIGGLLTAVVVVGFTVGRGVTGERLILAGIAVGAMLASVNDYLISRAPIESAEAAKAWQFGSLNIITWSTVGPLLIASGVLLPLAFLISRPALALDLGDDTATGLGVNVTRTRVGMLALGVTLAAVAVASAGPIGFLALAAPQLARRLARTAGISFAPSIAMGALLLSLADIAAQRLLSPFQIPVGLVSAAMGGLYLLWLLGFARD